MALFDWYDAQKQRTTYYAVEQVSPFLVERLKQLEQDCPDYWTFGGRDRREGAHAMYHYPAMMVPQMQGAIIDVLRSAQPTYRRVLDPFVGSGTTLVESMVRGLDFQGLDINPLAILVSRAKATIIPPREIEDAATRIKARIATDRGRSYYVSFPNQKKWFRSSASIALSRVARAIEVEASEEIRRVFWVVLARIVRATCNSRRSTYKLHVEPALNSDTVNALEQFEHQSFRVIGALSSHHQKLTAATVIKGRRYAGDLSLRVGNILDSEPGLRGEKAEIVITSPPYGDNQTTIPYGQYSYLPLQWIPTEDIASDIREALISNTHSTDTASLGGSLSLALERGDHLCGNLQNYRGTLEALRGNLNAQKRFASFAADIRQAIRLLAERTAFGGFHVWTVGERRIAGLQIPMRQMLVEMMEQENIRLIYTADRRILSKRMAGRNSLSDTMHSEQILIASKQ